MEQATDKGSRRGEMSWSEIDKTTNIAKEQANVAMIVMTDHLKGKRATRKTRTKNSIEVDSCDGHELI